MKWTQGEAMTAQEKAFVEDLWNTDPAKTSEYWAAGEFLDTEVPNETYEVLPLDKGSLDSNRKSWRQSEIDVGNIYRNTKLKNLLLKGKRFRMGLKEVPDRIITKTDIV